MQRRFVFVVGGARSGKSSFAMGLAASFAGPRSYVATAEALDAEMDLRIRRHREERGEGWETIEEPMDAAGAIERTGGGVVILDCVTLWVSNLIGRGLADEEILAEAGRLVSVCKGRVSPVIAVSNEVGLGVVPENGLARRFRDLSGMINQKIAAAADEVYLMASGLPLKMK